MQTANTVLPSFNRQHFFSSLTFGFLPLYSAVVLSLIIDQSLNRKIESILRSPDGFSHMVWFWGGLSLVSSLLFPTLFTLGSCFFITEKIKGHKISNLPGFLKQNFEMTLLENIRAWGHMFLWFFVFVFPAVYKFVSYAMTPFLVIYSPAYARGEVDALKTSEIVTKEFFIKLFFILLGFYLIIPAVGTVLFDQLKLFRLNPGPALLLAGLDTLIIFLVHFIVLKIFFNSSYFKGESHGAHV